MAVQQQQIEILPQQQFAQNGYYLEMYLNENGLSLRCFEPNTPVACPTCQTPVSVSPSAPSTRYSRLGPLVFHAFTLGIAFLIMKLLYKIYKMADEIV